MATLAPASTPPTFGTVLKEWRAIRRMSQLDLSNLAEVSARHISFLESGRSKPSRSMAAHLAEALEMPRSERNRLLNAAGFAPIWIERDLDAPEMAAVRDAMRWTLERHEPYPAGVLDRHWRLVDTNDTLAGLLAIAGLEPEVDFLAALMDGPLRSIIVNWPVVGRFMLTRLRTESAALGGDPVLDAAARRLADEPDIGAATELLPPVVPLELRVGDLELSLFSTIAQFGTAEDVALAELRLEFFFPSDEASRQFLHRLAGSGDSA